jgi:hypothetical protein
VRVSAQGPDRARAVEPPAVGVDTPMVRNRSLEVRRGGRHRRDAGPRGLHTPTQHSDAGIGVISFVLTATGVTRNDRVARVRAPVRLMGRGHHSRTSEGA